MARAVVRIVLGLLVAGVVGLVVSPLVWSAGAQPQAQPGQLPSAASTTLFPLPTATRPATTLATVPPASVGSPTSIRPATTFRPRLTVPLVTTSTTPTTVAPTTVAPIPNAAPAPVTLPLAIGHQSGHVSAFFPILGGLGIFSLIALLATQFVLTAPGRRGRGPTL